jgi:hypothetical protein
MDFFPDWDFGGVSLYIVIIAGRISETEMGGVGCAQRPLLYVKEPKRQVRAVHGRTHATCKK